MHPPTPFLHLNRNCYRVVDLLRRCAIFSCCPFCFPISPPHYPALLCPVNWSHHPTPLTKLVQNKNPSFGLLVAPTDPSFFSNLQIPLFLNHPRSSNKSCQPQTPGNSVSPPRHVLIFPSPRFSFFWMFLLFADNSAPIFETISSSIGLRTALQALFSLLRTPLPPLLVLSLVSRPNPWELFRCRCSNLPGFICHYL